MAEKIEMIIRKYWVYLITVAIGIILLVILRLGYPQDFKPSDVILTITAMIIAIYTYETYRLRKATVDNTAISTRSVLVLDLDPDNGSKKVFFWVENYGNFPAYNVEFEGTEFIVEEEQQSLSYKFEFEKIDVVPPHGKVQALFGFFKKNEEDIGITSERLFTLVNAQRILQKGFQLKTSVIYDDILGQSWKSNLGCSSIIGIIAEKPERIMRGSIKGKRV
jgi:hypothetical protein